MSDLAEQEDPTQNNGGEEANAEEYVPTFFTADSLPNATGKIASAFSNQALEQQREGQLICILFFGTLMEMT